MGGGADGRGRSRARTRAREAAQPGLATGDGRSVPRFRNRLPRPRAERMVLHAFLLPASPARVDARRRCDLSARAKRAPALPGRSRRICAHVRRAGRLPLLRPRCGAGLRPHLAARGTAASMRRALVIAAFIVLALPTQAFAHATLENTLPRFEQRLPASPRYVTLSFDQYVER